MLRVTPVISHIYHSAVPAQKYLAERRSITFQHHYTLGCNGYNNAPETESIYVAHLAANLFQCREFGNELTVLWSTVNYPLSSCRKCCLKYFSTPFSSNVLKPELIDQCPILGRKRIYKPQGNSKTTQSIKIECLTMQLSSYEICKLS